MISELLQGALARRRGEAAVARQAGRRVLRWWQPPFCLCAPALRTASPSRTTRSRWTISRTPRAARCCDAMSRFRLSTHKWVKKHDEITERGRHHAPPLLLPPHFNSRNQTKGRGVPKYGPSSPIKRQSGFPTSQHSAQKWLAGGPGGRAACRALSLTAREGQHAARFPASRRYPAPP